MVNSGTITPGTCARFPDDKKRFFNTVKAGPKNGKRCRPWGDILSEQGDRRRLGPSPGEPEDTMRFLLAASAAALLVASTATTTARRGRRAR